MNKNIYLIYGEESYLIDVEINKIVSSFSNESIVRYDMLETNITDAIEDINTMSLFSSEKAVICKNCYFLTGTQMGEIDHNIDILLSTLNAAEMDNILILTVLSPKLDERKKIVKELLKRVNVKCFNKLKDDELIRFIEQEFSSDKYKIESKTVRLFLSIVGSNLNIIHNEIEKLKLYKMDEKVILEEDVNNLSSRTLNDNIFDLVDSVVKGNTERALEVYDDLLILNEEPIKLIAVIANQFRLIYQTKVMYKSGYSELDISKYLEIHPYRIKLANEVYISEKALLNYIDKLADLDIKIKTGTLDKDIAFEMFLLEI